MGRGERYATHEGGRVEGRLLMMGLLNIKVRRAL
jgi:hypothetical protein